MVNTGNKCFLLKTDTLTQQKIPLKPKYLTWKLCWNVVSELITGNKTVSHMKLVNWNTFQLYWLVVFHALCFITFPSCEFRIFNFFFYHFSSWTLRNITCFISEMPSNLESSKSRLNCRDGASTNSVWNLKGPKRWNFSLLACSAASAVSVGRGACTGSFEITPYLLFPFPFVFIDESVVTSLPTAPSCSLDWLKAQLEDQKEVRATILWS